MFSPMNYTTFTCIKLYTTTTCFGLKNGHCQVGNIKLEISVKLKNVKFQNRENEKEMLLEVPSLLKHSTFHVNLNFVA